MWATHMKIRASPVWRRDRLRQACLAADHLERSQEAGVPSETPVIRPKGLVVSHFRFLLARRAAWERAARAVRGPLSMSTARDEAEVDVREVLCLVNRLREARGIDPIPQ